MSDLFQMIMGTTSGVVLAGLLLFAFSKFEKHYVYMSTTKPSPFPTEEIPSGKTVQSPVQISKPHYVMSNSDSEMMV